MLGSVDSSTIGFNEKNPFFLFFLIFLFLISLGRIIFLWLQIWPINGDEAQYWSWSQHLAWGYYSKPPMVAWLIALSTKIAGNGFLGLRLVAPLTHSMTALMIYLSASYLFTSKSGFWAGITYLLLPGVTFSASIISTDPPLLMFWSMAFYCFIRSVQENKYLWWGALGITLGFALLSKYAALFFLISMAFYFAMDKKARTHISLKGLVFSLLITFFVLLPNLLWNLQHHFVSVIAVKDNAALQNHLFHFDKLVIFIAAQVALFGVILFPLFIYLLVNGHIWADTRYRLLLAFILPVFLVMSTEAFLIRAHANWSAPMYITATILVANFLVEKNKIYGLVLTLLLNLLVFATFFFIKPIINFVSIHIHPSTSVVNWPTEGKMIQQIVEKYPQAKILVMDRMLLTEIMYFSKIPLDRMYKWNPYHRVKDQYDMISHMDKEQGQNFLLFTYHIPSSNITSRFGQAKQVAKISLRAIDDEPLPVYIYYLENFKGYSDEFRGKRIN